MSLRTQKAARIKVQVLDHTIKMIGKKSFDDLYIDDLCAKVKISKVTLFKYFPQKEDILLYYFRVWCLARSVELLNKPKEGLQGIYYLFDKLCQSYENNPGLLLGLVRYLTDMNRSFKPFPIKPDEKKLLFPQMATITSVEMYSVDQMLEKFVLEAMLNKEITRTSGTRDITNALTTLFFGCVIAAHLQKLNPARLFFRRNIDMVMRGLS
jgi:AcrR family transcriptional regulator